MYGGGNVFANGLVLGVKFGTLNMYGGGAKVFANELVSKLYDERGEPLSELVFDISNHKRVFIPSTWRVREK